MATYPFELHGCNEENLAAVEAALAAIPGLKCKVVKSARGGFVVFVESDLSEAEVVALINGALEHLGVTIGKQHKPSGPRL